MENRFRFRAWDKKREIMFDDVEKSTGHYDFGDYKNADEYVLMQCTGLRDKNGTLIYEGDIINYEDGYKICDDWDTFMNRGVVEWCNEEGKDYANGFTLTERSQVDMEDIIRDGVLDGVVVGNIHEHKDLLDDDRGA